jgi:hypothetical protein
VVVAVAAMRVVKVAGDEVISVVAVRNGFVAAALAVLVAGGMPGALMAGGAGIRVGRVDRDGVFIRVPAMHMV